MIINTSFNTLKLPFLAISYIDAYGVLHGSINAPMIFGITAFYNGMQYTYHHYNLNSFYDVSILKSNINRKNGDKFSNLIYIGESSHSFPNGYTFFNDFIGQTDYYKICQNKDILFFDWLGNLIPYSVIQTFHNNTGKYGFIINLHFLSDNLLKYKYLEDSIGVPYSMKLFYDSILSSTSYDFWLPTHVLTTNFLSSPDNMDFFLGDYYFMNNYDSLQASLSGNYPIFNFNQNFPYFNVSHKHYFDNHKSFIDSYPHSQTEIFTNA